MFDSTRFDALPWDASPQSTVAPIATTATGGLVLSGASIPTPGAFGTGGLVTSGTSVPIPGFLGTGGLSASGTKAATAGVATGVGGLSLSGTAPITWGTITGTGGLVVSAQTTTVYPIDVPPLLYLWPWQLWSHTAPTETFAAGGLSASGSAFAVPGLVGQGGASASGHAFPSVVTIAAGGLSASGATLPLSKGTTGTGGLSASGSVTSVPGRFFGLGGLTASGSAQPASLATLGIGGLTASGSGTVVANSTVLAVGGLTLSGTAQPGVLGTLGTGGLAATGSATPTLQTAGLGGLTSSGIGGVTATTVGTGGLSASGTGSPLYITITQGSGGLAISGSAGPAPDTIGQGGLTLSGQLPAVLVRQSTGGLVASGTASPILTTFAAYARGGLSASGMMLFPNVARVGMGGLAVSGGMTADVPLPFDLQEAIVAQLRATMAGVITVHAGFAGPETPMPYTEVYEVTESRSQMSGNRSYLANGMVQINVYSPSRLTSRHLGDALWANLRNQPLANQANTIMHFVPTDRRSNKDLAPGPGGEAVNQEVRTFVYTASGLNPL